MAQELSQCPVWKTITLGGRKGGAGYRRAIIACRMTIGAWADSLLRSRAFTTSRVPIDVDLLVVTVAELGFEAGARYAEICERGTELSLALCPAEVSPTLRLEYREQPQGEWLVIAMEPIADSAGTLLLFLVGTGSKAPTLSADRGHPDSFWQSKFRFVFIRPTHFNGS